MAFQGCFRGGSGVAQGWLRGGSGGVSWDAGTPHRLQAGEQLGLAHALPRLASLGVDRNSAFGLLELIRSQTSLAAGGRSWRVSRRFGLTGTPSRVPPPGLSP